MKKWLSLLLFIIPFNLISQYDTEVIHPNLVGQELLDMVVLDFKPNIVLPYGPARDSMFSNIYNVNDSLSCVYSGHRLYMDPSLDPTDAVFLNGIDDGINTEHTYPRSKGAENGFARSDMNHLYPTRVRVNAERANLPFGDIDDHLTLKWFHNNNSQNQIPSENIDDYSEWNGQVFEPREDHKGNVARAMFYFYTMYNAEANSADPDFFPPQITTLCNWHELDPVDSLEWTRALKIATYQDNKANPFVLDCTLAGRTYCPEVSSQCRAVTASDLHLKKFIKVYPNPADDIINIEIDYNKKITYVLVLFDYLGNIIFSTENQIPGYYHWIKIKKEVQWPSHLSIIRLVIKSEWKSQLLNYPVYLIGN